MCKPVLVAHSLMAAIWLIRETLSDAAVPDSAWESLVSAAKAQAGELERQSPTDVPPPSAQALAALSPPQGASKQSFPSASTASLSERPSKRQLRSAADTATVASSSSPITPPQATTQEHFDEELASTPQLTAPSIPSNPGAGDNMQQHATTVSNHNRRAEQARAKKREAAREKAKVARRLAPPPQGVSRKERSAYDSIKPDDEAHISWLLKQPVKGEIDLFGSTQAPYAQAAAMLEKAQSIGNTSSRASAAAFLRSWRTQGTPFRQDSITAPSLDPAASAASSRSSLTQTQSPSHTNCTSVTTLVSA